jgi:putative membrane protein
MWLDAALAYLHYLAIFTLFAFLAVEAVTLGRALDAERIRMLARIDVWYFGSAFAVLVTGFLRLALGAKGADFYLAWWPIYVKVGLFLAIGLMSVGPTLTFIRWRRALEHDAAWRPPQAEHRKARRIVMAELHIAALIPIAAVIMSRGIGR